jgi:hypothetical protein
MQNHNLEQQLKAHLAQKTAPVPANLWEAIDAGLRQEPEKKKSLTWLKYLSAACVVLCFGWWMGHDKQVFTQDKIAHQTQTKNKISNQIEGNQIQAKINQINTNNTIKSVNDEIIAQNKPKTVQAIEKPKAVGIEAQLEASKQIIQEQKNSDTSGVTALASDQNQSQKRDETPHLMVNIKSKKLRVEAINLNNLPKNSQDDEPKSLTYQIVDYVDGSYHFVRKQID